MNYQELMQNTRLPDQGLKVGDIVYSQYYDRLGKICRMSPIQDDPTNPSYVLSNVYNQDIEILFGVREHNWHYVDTNKLRYSRLIKFDLPSFDSCSDYELTPKLGEV